MRPSLKLSTLIIRVPAAVSLAVELQIYKKPVVRQQKIREFINKIECKYDSGKQFRI